jgi:UPF0716 protein FxsA
MWLLLALVALPLIEIALFVVIGGAIGLWATLAWVVISAILGILTLRWIARLGPISFARDVNGLRDPTSPVAARALTILAGVLLILPGFFTDTLGLLLLLQPVQSLLIRVLTKRYRQYHPADGVSMTIEGSWSETTSTQDGGIPRSTDGGQPPSGMTRH